MERGTYITVISTLAGAFVGGLVSEARNVLQLRREATRSKNNLLYKLLDIWYIVKARNIDEFIKEFMERLSLKLNVKEDIIVTELGKSIDLKKVFQDIIISNFPSNNLEDKYQDAVDALGPLDPILAYYMSGKGSIARYEQISTAIKQYIAEKHPPESEGATKFLDHILSYAENTLSKEVLKTLEEDIRHVSSRIGRKTRRQVNEAFNRLETRVREERLKLIDDYIDHVLKFAFGS